MAGSKIAGHFKGNSILITGSTGFLGKVLVEKILRIQPEVKKIFLLVRAQDTDSARQRVKSEVIEKEIFDVLREEHGSEGYCKFMEEKISAVAGDIIFQNLGIHESSQLEHLFNEIDVIVNSAATTNFHERYDVALDVNTLGAKHVLDFAKKCVNLKMLLHVSTAYVAGLQEGLIQERPLEMGATLNGSSGLDIESELRLVAETKEQLQSSTETDSATISRAKLERKAMKELGINRARKYGWPNTYVFTKALGEMVLGHMRGDVPLVIIRPTIITSLYKEPLPGWMEGIRTIDSFILGYAKGSLLCYQADLKEIMDVIPGDMVVNAMIAAMVMNSGENAQTVYHVSSSMRNPVRASTVVDSVYQYFREINYNPRNIRMGIDKAGKCRRIRIFSSAGSFKTYMTFRYKLPLLALHVVNLLFCGAFTQLYKELSGHYYFTMLLVEVYGVPICCHKKLWHGCAIVKTDRWIDLNGPDFRNRRVFFIVGPMCIDGKKLWHNPAIENYGSGCEFEVYGPYAIFRGRFDDLNLQRLRLSMESSNSITEAQDFCFDPKVIDWGNYLCQTHIPAALRYLNN